MTTPSNGTEDPPLPGARLAEELRLLLDALAERAQPWLNRLATESTDSDGEHTPATCGWCPVCAGMAVLRGERPELAVRAAEHAAGLVAVLRSALAQPEAPQPSDAGDDRVEHITVRRRDHKDGEC